jgi:hypothetical protein
LVDTAHRRSLWSLATGSILLVQPIVAATGDVIRRSDIAAMGQSYNVIGFPYLLDDLRRTSTHLVSQPPLLSLYVVALWHPRTGRTGRRHPGPRRRRRGLGSRRRTRSLRERRAPPTLAGVGP